MHVYRCMWHRSRWQKLIAYGSLQMQESEIFTHAKMSAIAVFKTTQTSVDSAFIVSSSVLKFGTPLLHIQARKKKLQVFEVCYKGRYGRKASQGGVLPLPVSFAFSWIEFFSVSLCRPVMLLTLYLSFLLFGQRLFTTHPHVSGYILFKTRTGDEKDDNNGISDVSAYNTFREK